MSRIDIILSGPEALTQSGYFFKGRAEIKDFGITVRFRLADMPRLGVLSLTCRSWAFASQLASDGVRERLEEIGGPATATLEVEEGFFTAKRGGLAGEKVPYSQPVLTILGPAATGETPGDAGGGV